MHIVRSELLDELVDVAAASNRALVRITTWRGAEAREDADGDLDLPRKRRQQNSPSDQDSSLIVLETAWEGTADATGSQLWRASLLLAEYLKSQRGRLADATLLELGCGVGLVAVVAARVARLVVATDGDCAALALCERNLERNGCDPKCTLVRHLRWGCRGREEGDYEVPERFEWLETSGERVDWIVASDVFYDDEVAGLFLDTLHSLILQHPHVRVVVAAEKRIVFSAVTLTEISLGYDAFCSRLCLHQSVPDDDRLSCVVTCSECELKCDASDPSNRFVTTPIAIDSVPRLYLYERASTLAIWRLYAVVKSSVSNESGM